MGENSRPVFGEGEGGRREGSGVEDGGVEGEQVEGERRRSASVMALEECERQRTGFGRKHGLVLDESLDPGEDVVDVLRRRELDALSRSVDPGVVHAASGVSARKLPGYKVDAPWSSRHGWVVLDGAELGHDRVEEIEVVEEVDHCEESARAIGTNLRQNLHANALTVDCNPLVHVHIWRRVHGSAPVLHSTRSSKRRRLTLCISFYVI